MLNLHPEIVQSVGKKNYLKGNGRYTDIPQYGQIQYRSLWEGVDVDFYAHKRQLKYDFIVAPFADPALIQFQLTGASEVHVDEATGELAFVTPLGELRKGVPYTYQIIEKKKIAVKSKYVIKEGIISFALGKYDPSYPLIIDPIALKFATFLGGNSDDAVYDIYVHPTSKKIYLTGVTTSSSFPGVTGTAVTNSINYDGFITCMSKDGSTVLWTTILGGDEDDDELYKIHVSDDENDIFVSGVSKSDDYPTDGLLTPYAADLAGGNNPIISRLNGDGTVLKYSTYFPVNSFALERYTVVGDLVYGATYYDANDAANYPITMPAGAYISTPPSENGHNGQIFFAINTALAGDASFQYGTFWYDTTAGSYSYIEFSDSDVDGDGNIYFGGFFDIGEPTFGPENLFPTGGIQTMDDIYTHLTIDGFYSVAGWVAQFDPTLSNLMYATPFIPVMHNSYTEVSHYDYLFNLAVTDNGDIYTTHVDEVWSIIDITGLTVAPTAKYSPLQAFKLFFDELLIHVATKIAAADRTQFEYIVTAAGDWTHNHPAAGGKVDSQGRLHWAFSKNKGDIALDALATEGALQSMVLPGDQTQYVILSPSGDLEYATIIGPSLDFSGSMDVYSHASFIADDGTFYVGGSIESNAQQSFPVTTSYWDTETASQVFVHDATPTTNLEGWLAVFHEPTPTDNVITDFTSGNDTFCVNAMIYQDPNYGPIVGDPISFLSGDGSLATHVLPDIRPTPFTEAHPNANGKDALHWEISRDNGSTWTALSNSAVEVYKPAPETSAGTVQYRRVYTYGPAATPVYSNVATAEIVGSFGLDLQSPTEPIYFCPGTVEDITFPIAGASGNITWQWYDGFAPVDNTVINPASGTDLPANFQAMIPAGVSQGGFYRLVVEDGTGCAAEISIRTRPLSDDAGSGAILAICPGDAANEVRLGPATPNPNFEYAWTGPGGFSTSLANPVVSVDGTYYLQVKLAGDPSFCSGGETSVAVLPMTAHDTVLVDTNINLAFCQSDAPMAIGLAGPPPVGYAFQWSPALSIDDVTAFNPTYFPSDLAFGPPVTNIAYTFTAIRLSDGCVFEDTIAVSTTALATARAGQDRNLVCTNTFIIGSESTGDYFEWRAIASTFPGGLGALTSDPAFSIDGAGNLGTNKFAIIGFPAATDTAYYIDFEVQSSYAVLPNACFDADTVRLTIFPCGPGDVFFCPNISTTNIQGTSGVCGVPGNQLTVNEISGGTYEWTTYAVDGVVQASGTAPRGLFEPGGTALPSAGPHATEVITDLEDPTWGWPGAAYVEYEVTLTLLIHDTLLICSDRIVVYSAIVGRPEVDVKEIDICNANSPGTLLTGNGTNLPYQLTGIDYNSAPNSLLVWSWTGGPITSDGDSPFPTLEPTETTLYRVTVTDPATGCFDSDTFWVRMHTIVADAGADITTPCTGSVVQLGTAAKSNYTYQWSPTSGLNFPIGTPNSAVARPYLTVPGTPTSYSLVATELTTGCQATDTVLVTPGASAPTAPTAATYTSCPDGELVIGTLYTPATGIDFSWTAGAGANISWLDNTTINQPTVSLPSSFSGSATFTLTVSNGSCGAASRDYTITNSVADVALGPDVTAVCQSPFLSIGSATKTADFIYQWFPADGLFLDDAGAMPYSTQSVKTVYAQPSTSTEYTLTARNLSTGCMFIDKITVDAPAGVDVDAGSDQLLCPGESAVTIGQSGSGTISWVASGYNSDPTGVPATPGTADSTTMMSYLSGTSSATITFSQGTFAPGVYEYQITADYGGGCTATDEVIVTVPSITTGLAGSSKTVCEGENVILGTTLVPGVTYAWSILTPTVQSGTISDPTSANPSVNPTATTSYRLTYTDVQTGCEVTEVVTVSAIASPVIDDVVLGPLCPPLSAQNLVALIPNYGTLTSAIWYIDYEGGTIESSPTAVSPSRTTTYYLRGYNASGCSDLATITVLVESPQTPNILPLGVLDCATNLLDLADYQGPAQAGFTFEWHSANNTNPASLLASTVVSATGTYYLFKKSTALGGCYSAADSITLSRPISCNRALLGNYIWLDEDQDGIQDAAERGLSGVPVQLLNASGSVIAATQTDAFGAYGFKSLAPGAYRISVTPPANYTFAPADAGSNDTLDSDINPLSGISSTFILAFGDTNLLADAGLVFASTATISLGDYVWIDLDADDTQGGADFGFSGVTVSLFDNADNPVATTISDQAGVYLFRNLAPGTYKIGASLPAGVGFVNQTIGDATGSDIDPATAKTPTVTLVSGDQFYDLDIGLKIFPATMASIGDKVWNDLNQNGLQEAGEPGIPGVAVSLYGADGTTLLATTQSDAFGTYMFTGLGPGKYHLAFAALAGYTFTSQFQGADPALNSDVYPTGLTDPLIVFAGEVKTTLDAGMYQTAPAGTARIGDLVWFDYDQDGIQDPGEPGAPGLTVTLYNNADLLVAKTTSQQNGYYTFTELAAGSYYIVVDNYPEGFAPSPASQGGDNALDSDVDEQGKSMTIVLANGQNHTSLDAGIAPGVLPTGTASLGGRSWNDLNADGLQDAGELGIPGIQVRLYAQDGTTLLDSILSNALGEYIFTGLDSGTYLIEFVPATFPANYLVSSQDQGPDDALDSDIDTGTGRTSLVSLNIGQQKLTLDGGLYNPTANLSSIGDRVWNDLDADGIYETGEGGVAGVSVTLYTALGDTTAITTTDKEGRYRFADLPPGNYQVGFSNLPAGYTFSPQGAGANQALDSDVNIYTGRSAVFALPLNVDTDSIDAGITAATAVLGDYVWMDTNANGLQEAGETGIAGVTVTLLDAGSSPIGQAITDKNGAYLFQNLTAGTYSLQFSSLPAGTEFSPKDNTGNDTNDSDGDPATGSMGPIVLTGATIAWDWDQGVQPAENAGLGDYVWFDANIDGAQNNTEPGVSGAAVTLYDSGSNPQSIAISDAAGLYQFLNLAPGNYHIGITSPFSHASFTAQNAGSASEATDSDVATGTGISDPVSLSSNEVHSDLDAGLQFMAVLGGLVWYDDDRDGILSYEEALTTGVTVELLAADSSTVLQTTTTDAHSGNYFFFNLAGGDYFVRFRDLPATYGFTLPNAGGNDQIDSDAIPASTLDEGTSFRVSVPGGGTNLFTFAGLSNTPFDVEWLDFTVSPRGGDALLEWATAQENQAAHYEIERSVNGRLFQQIGQQAANGTTTQISQYQFLDPQITRLAGKTFFYRIRQVDLEGESSYSAVQELRLDQAGPRIALYASPVPVSDLLTLDYDLINLSAAQLEVFNSFGQKVHTQQVSTPKGSIELSVVPWSSGVYYLSMTGEEVKEILKIVVRH